MKKVITTCFLTAIGIYTNAQSPLVKGGQQIGMGAILGTNNQYNDIKGSSKDNLNKGFYTYNVLYYGKFIKDNTALGLATNVLYDTQSQKDLAYNNFETDRRNDKSISYGISPYMQVFYPIYNKFNISLKYSIGLNYKNGIQNGYNVAGDLTYKNQINSIGINAGVYPSINYILNRNCMISLNISGVSASTSKGQTEAYDNNNILQSDAKDQSVNFNLNPFSSLQNTSIGFSFFINSTKQESK